MPYVGNMVGAISSVCHHVNAWKDLNVGFLQNGALEIALMDV